VANFNQLKDLSISDKSSIFFKAKKSVGSAKRGAIRQCPPPKYATGCCAERLVLDQYICSQKMIIFMYEDNFINCALSQRTSLCVINFIYLEIFTQAIQQISTGRSGAPTIRRRRRRRRCAKAKFSEAAAPAITRRRHGWRGVESSRSYLYFCF
jgi:hypothetical protein